MKLRNALPLAILVSIGISAGQSVAATTKPAADTTKAVPAKPKAAQTKARSAPATPAKPAAGATRSASAKASPSKAASAKTTAKKGSVKASARAKQAQARKVAIESRELNHYSVDREGNPLLRSSAVLVQDQVSGEVLFEKNSAAVVPIASITKLMTAMVALDAKPNLHETLSIGEDDVDALKGTRSRLAVGTRLSREDMLRLALMSSENRAASALSRHYPGGSAAFIEAMNRKARELGLTDTRFFDPTGLNSSNVSSARDLCKMVAAAADYPLIRDFSTMAEYTVTISGRPREFHNTNALVRSPDWDIAVSKTGYISEAGRCLVMQARLNDKPVIIVLLDSWGKFTRIGDANRIKRWMESARSSPRSSS
jgi:D-alanyl-D-alanine endopeptidase (penicillin-binding protein 7)